MRSFFTIKNILKLTFLFTCMVFLLGFWFHTSYPHTNVFGKYSVSYFKGLCIASVIFPFVIYYLFQILNVKEITFPSGRKIEFSTWTKIKIIIVILLIILIPLEIFVRIQSEAVISQRRKRLKEYHPFLQNSPIPGDKRFHVNRWGFRSDEIDRIKPDRTYRIFMLGGSTFLSLEVDYEHLLSRIFEKELKKHYSDIQIEVQNASSTWHSSLHSLIKLYSWVQDFDPDMIIVCHAVNDLYRGFSAPLWTDGKYWADYRHFLGPVASMKRKYSKSNTFPILFFNRFTSGLKRNWFSDFTKQHTPQEITIKSWRSLDAYKRNMKNIISFAKVKGIEVVFVSQPFFYKKDMSEGELKMLAFPGNVCVENEKIPDIPSMIRGMNLFNNTAKNIAGRDSVHFINLADVIPKTLDYFIDDVHYTQKASELIGLEIAESIINTGYIDNFRN